MEIRSQSLSNPLLALALLAFTTCPTAFGQPGTSPVSAGSPASAPRTPALSGNWNSLPPAPPLPRAGTQRPIFLLTGYRPPTNEMVRHFASEPTPSSSWLGSDWEGRGYDIQAYFPEFVKPSCGPRISDSVAAMLDQIDLAAKA